MSIFRWINTGVVIPVFNFLGKFISNYGIIILLLTIFIKLVLFPLILQELQEQALMRVLGPHIKAINDKYPGTENAMTRQQRQWPSTRKPDQPDVGLSADAAADPILFAIFSFFLPASS